MIYSLLFFIPGVSYLYSNSFVKLLLLCAIFKQNLLKVFLYILFIFYNDVYYKNFVFYNKSILLTYTGLRFNEDTTCPVFLLFLVISNSFKSFYKLFSMSFKLILIKPICWSFLFSSNVYDSILMDFTFFNIG